MNQTEGLGHNVTCRFRGLWKIAKHTYHDVLANELLTRASGIAFGAMMAAVPFLALVITISALVLPAAGVDGKDLLHSLEALLGTVFPEEAHLVIEEQIARLQSNQPIAVMSISLAITLWLASGLFAAVIDGLNRIYGVKDTRPYWKFRLTAMWITIVQSVILLGAVVAIFAFPLLVDWIGVTFNVPGMATYVTWFIIFMMVLASFALLFAAGPDVKQAHRWVTPGSVFGAAIFLLTTYGFQLYVKNLAHYDVTYGSLGGVMMLMFWLYISSLVLLVAGQVNKIFYKAREWGSCDDAGITPGAKNDAAAVASSPDPKGNSMRRNWKFCPQCGSGLAEMTQEGQELHGCTACNFVDYNNPVPVVAALIVEDGKVVLVKRKVAPFVGRWCLPRGFLKTDENPKGAVVREAFEETGLHILLKRMLNACNPSPKNFPLNQLTMFYLATVVGGAMQHGDDADEVGLFAPDALPDICFGTDTRIIADWFAGIHGTVDTPVNYSPPESSRERDALRPNGDADSPKGKPDDEPPSRPWEPMGPTGYGC